MKKEIAEKILNETELGYDLISNKFSQTRKHFWRGLEFISNYTQDGDKIFDFGCGNGRLLELFEKKSIQYFGADVSHKLIDHANGTYAKENVTFLKLNPNQTSLAFEEGFFNTIYSIAVFHHFPSKKYRQDVALELFKKTHENGHIIITVWYLWQQRYLRNILKNWISKIKGESLLDWNDCEISFTDNQGVKFQRFHHAFTKREMKKLFKDAGFKIEKCKIVDGRNILLIGKKL